MPEGPKLLPTHLPTLCAYPRLVKYLRYIATLNLFEVAALRGSVLLSLIPPVQSYESLANVSRTIYLEPLPIRALEDYRPAKQLPMHPKDARQLTPRVHVEPTTVTGR